MTISLVAVETDVVRDGKPGDRLRLLLQRPLCAGRHPARALHPAHPGGRPEVARRRDERQPRSRSPSGRPSWPTRSRAATATGRTPPARSTWPCGMRWPRSPASRCGGCCPSASTAARFDETVLVYPGGGYYYPGKELDGLRAEMRGYQEQGYKVVKMKIGGADLATDLKRIEAVIEVAGTGDERRRRCQRPLRSRHRARLRQGHAALRPVLVRGAGRPARLPAQCRAGRALCRRAGDRREPVLGHRRPQPAALRRPAARPRLGAARSGARLRPHRVSALSRCGRGRWAGRGGGSSRTAAISWRSTSRPACSSAARRAIPACSSPTAASPTPSRSSTATCGRTSTPGIGMELQRKMFAEMRKRLEFE